MKAVYPNNPKHNRFITVAHITQDWKVDENGNFIEVVQECCDVIHGPDRDNYWTCDICGADAIVID